MERNRHLQEWAQVQLQDHLDLDPALRNLLIQPSQTRPKKRAKGSFLDLGRKLPPSRPHLHHR
ncbi:unnamed protein product [Strongylus vulgaris]|uniref:Uncharacterized protein n=1 Tax=Strongylus vulgaris TaxID=40348 RepID=A0A3P7IJX5_STRVU|nr:unnamed protein product [Strongylus vulgaris]